MSPSKTVTISGPILPSSSHVFLKLPVAMTKRPGCAAKARSMPICTVITSRGPTISISTVRELRAGRLNGRPNIAITHETAATARVDGDGGPGHVDRRLRDRSCDQESAAMPASAPSALSAAAISSGLATTLR